MTSLVHAFSLETTALGQGRPHPVANPDTLALDADAVGVVDILANDRGLGPAPRVTAVAGGQVGAPFRTPRGALATLAADGLMTYDPAGAFATLPLGAVAVESFVYLTSADVAAAVTVSIRGVNAPPAAARVLADVAAIQHTPIAPVAAGADFADPGDPLRFVAENLPAGLSIDPGTGVIEGVPLETAAGRVVRVRATDTAGQSAESAFSIDVAALPAPRLTAPVAAVSWAVGDASTLSLAPHVAGVVDVWTMAPGSDGLPAGRALDAATGVISGVQTGAIPASTLILRARNRAGFVDVAVPLAATPPVVVVAAGAAPQPSVNVVAGSTTTVTPNTPLPGVFRCRGSVGTAARVDFVPAAAYEIGRTYRIRWRATGVTIAGGTASIRIRAGAAGMSATGAQDLSVIAAPTAIPAIYEGDVLFTPTAAVERIGLIAIGNAVGQGFDLESFTVERVVAAPSAAPYRLAPRSTVYVAAGAIDIDLAQYFSATAKIGLAAASAPAPDGTWIAGGRLRGALAAGRRTLLLRGETTAGTTDIALELDARAALPATPPVVATHGAWNGGALTIALGDAPTGGANRVVALLFQARGAGVTRPASISLTPAGGSAIAMAEAPAARSTIASQIGGVWFADVPAGATTAVIQIAAIGITPTAGNFLAATYVLRDVHVGAFDATGGGSDIVGHATAAAILDGAASGVTLALGVATSASGAPRADMPSLASCAPLPAAVFGATASATRVAGFTLYDAETLSDNFTLATSEPDDEGGYPSEMTNSTVIAASFAARGAARVVSPGYPALRVHGRIGARAGVAGEAFRLDLREGYVGDYEGATITAHGSGDALPSGWSIDGGVLIAANPVAGAHAFVFRIEQGDGSGGTETALLPVTVTVVASAAGNLIDLAQPFTLGAATVTSLTGGRRVAFTSGQFSSGLAVATEPRATYRLTVAWSRAAGAQPLLLRAASRLVEANANVDAFNDDIDGFLGEAVIGTGAGVATVDFVAASAITEIGVGTFFTQITGTKTRPTASGTTVDLTYASLRRLPETMAIGAAATVDRVRMFEHTYVFDAPRPVTRAVNGAYIVHNADPAGDPVKIEAIWPPSRTRPAGTTGLAASQPVTLHGAHVNWGAQFVEQGFDSFHGGTGNYRYAATRNRDPGFTGRAIVFSDADVGAQGAVDKATSAERGYFQNGLAIQRLLSQTALTVATTAPTPGRTPFQPPTGVVAKSFRYVEDIPQAFFDAIPAVAVPAGESGVAFDRAMYFIHRQPQVGVRNNPAQRNISPRYTQREYGREIAERREEVFTALMLNELTAPQKRALMTQVVQHGVLWDGFDRAGGVLNCVGGGSANFKGFPVLAALAFDDAAWKARLADLSRYTWADDGFHARVTKLIVDTPKAPSTVNGYTRPLAPHSLAQIGQPEHFQWDSATRRPDNGASYSSARATTYYRGNATSYVYAMTLFMRLYPQALATFANPVRDAYLDRHLLMGPMRTGDLSGAPADAPPPRTTKLWRAHRAQGRPVAANLFGLTHQGGGAYPPAAIPTGANTNTMNDTYPAPFMPAKWRVGVTATHDVAALEFANAAMTLADGAPTAFALVAARRWSGTVAETIALPGWATVNPSTGVLSVTPPDAALYWFDVEGANAAGAAVATVAVQAAPS